MSSDLEKNQHIDSFLSNLRLEKGLSENTIKAYSTDCYAFIDWIYRYPIGVLGGFVNIF